jgi:hypothetical protein
LSHFTPLTDKPRFNGFGVEGNGAPLQKPVSLARSDICIVLVDEARRLF